MIKGAASQDIPQIKTNTEYEIKIYCRFLIESRKI